MAIKILSPERLLKESFEDSALWHKISRLILVAVVYEENDPLRARACCVQPVDIDDPLLRQEIEKFWREIRATVTAGKIAEYSSKGTSHNMIQLRTKGPGGEKGLVSCSVTGKKFNSRAFYATKAFFEGCLWSS